MALFRSTAFAARRYCGSMHSTDIAFKPNEDGWGYNKNYGNNFDRIFGKKTPQAAAQTEEPAKQEAPKKEQEA